MRRLIEYSKDPWRDVIVQAAPQRVQRPNSAKAHRTRPANSGSLSKGKVPRPCSARADQRYSPTAKAGSPPDSSPAKVGSPPAVGSGDRPFVSFDRSSDRSPGRSFDRSTQLKLRGTGSPAKGAVNRGLCHLRTCELRWNAHNRSWMPEWIQKHHLTNSKDNFGMHYSQKGYFDELPTAHLVESVRHCSRKEAGNHSSNRPTSASRSSSKEVVAKSRPSSVRTSKTSKFQLRRLSTRDLQEIPGMIEFYEFYNWCISKFKNLTRCWRLLDKTLNMKLTYIEFLTGLNEYQFKKDCRSVFHWLDRDKTGNLQYYHFDPHGALELGALLAWARRRFGSIAQAFDKLDMDRNGKLSLEEFLQGAKKHGLDKISGVPHLYEMLDLDQDKKVTKPELSFIDAWNPPAWLLVPPNFKAAEAFKASLIAAAGGNPWRAWRQIDIDCNFRICWDEFSASYLRILDGGIDGSSENLFSKDDLPGIWRALDDNISGWLSLHEFDDATFQLLKKFKIKAEQMYGSLTKYFTVLDGKNRRMLYRRDFAKVKEDVGLSDHECEIIFSGLIKQKNEEMGYIKESSFRFLENWKLKEEVDEHNFFITLCKHLRQEEAQMNSFSSVNGSLSSDPISPRLSYSE